MDRILLPETATATANSTDTGEPTANFVASTVLRESSIGVSPATATPVSAADSPHGGPGLPGNGPLDP